MLKQLLYFIRNFLSIIYSNYFPEKIQLKLFPYKFYVKYRVFLRLRDLYLPVYLLTGKEKNGKNIKVLFSGDEFAYLYLIKTIFSETPKKEYIKEIPFWSINKSIKDLSDKADLFFIKTDRFFSRRLQNKGLIIIPDWVDSWIDVSVPKDDILKNLKKSAREDVVKLKKYGYTYDFSSKPEDFEFFYKNLYVPFMQNRHGVYEYPSWWTLDYAEMIGMFQSKRAKLLWVKDKDKYVAGVVMFNVKKIAYPIYMGVDINSDYWEKCGSAAIYYFSTIWAKENGFKLVRIGDVRSFFHDGLFQYKRKWGIFINENYNRLGIIGLKICNYKSPAVVDFLENNPFIYSNKGILKGFIFIKNEVSSIKIQDIFKEYYTNGLKNITIAADYHDLKQLFNSFDKWKKDEAINIPLDAVPNCDQIFSGILTIENEMDLKSAIISYKTVGNYEKSREPPSTDESKKFIEEYSLNIQQAEQIVSKGYQNEVEKLIQQFPAFKNIIVQTFLSTFAELRKKNLKTQNITYEMLKSIFTGLSEKKISKEAIPYVIDFFIKHKTNDIDLALFGCNIRALDKKGVERIIAEIVNDNLDFVKKEGMNSFKPLMGQVMKKIRGQYDGESISKILKNKIKIVTR